MEYCLVGMWREQTAHFRVLKALPGLWLATHLVYGRCLCCVCDIHRTGGSVTSESLAGVSHGPLHITIAVLHYF